MCLDSEGILTHWKIYLIDEMKIINFYNVN